jgi:proline dehydrogenase
MINSIILKTLPIVPKSIIRIFADKYIAGESLSEAIKVVKDLENKGARSTIDVLGEYAVDKDKAAAELGLRIGAIISISSQNLDATESIKLTALGLGLDDDFAYENTKLIVKIAHEKGVFIQIDMEDSPYTDRTIDFYKRLRADGYDNVGMVFQSYLKRTYEDIKSLIEYKPVVRLTKGIYIEPAEISFKEHSEINESYKSLLNLMFENGMYVGIATHDEELLNYAEELIQEKELTDQHYEFQMLLGVREDKRDELISKGHKMRIYVSFGADWYGYSMRRFKENPKILSHVTKAMFN